MGLSALSQVVVPVQNNSYVERVRYLINENYSSLILINIKNSTYLCLILGNFFQKSTDHKQNVNTK
jgi:hypothetical protein